MKAMLSVRTATVARLITAACAGVLLAPSPASAINSSATSLTGQVTSGAVNLGSSKLTTTYTTSQDVLRRAPAGRG